MTLVKQKLKTSIILILIFVLCVYILCAAKDVQIRKEAEFATRYELWQARNPEVEAKIKGYIDNIDWGYYINQFADALAHPGITAKELYEYYGVK